MKELLNRFIRNLLIFTAVIALAGIAVSHFTSGLVTNYWAVLLLLFAGITLTSVTLLFSATEKKFSRFSNTFMISSMGKILLLLIIIAAYSYTQPADAVRFSVTLLVFHILFLVFEVTWLLKIQRTGKDI